ncbi:hypothetical protein yc1106_01680 [Curvularia clavata]|uniref:DDE-1 domain-containing protein n=1 Tax=Curvularia clavata TaxID=95742 RepID=A0A9Q9DQK3_CURCL|nr:hypothetical protein yc1106_01680 [Curvularia clavata]
MPRQPRAQSTSRKDRTSLAAASYHNNPNQSIHALAKAYDVLKSTLQTRLRGVQPRSETASAKRKLSPIEEQSLVQWILKLDKRGFPPHIIDVRRMVDVLLAARGQDPPLQPVELGNREWVIAIECVNASGWFLPPLVILSGKVHQNIWYRDLPLDWTVGVSDNGWTIDELGVEWVKHFNQHIAARTAGDYRLLIVDGYGSHATPEFDQYCAENKIITLCMPPHTFYLLQPLDVGCYSPLKRAYGREVDELARQGVYYIDKIDFLTAYTQIRPTIFTQQNIQAGF